MAGAAAARAEGQRLMEALRAAGAEPVEARILQPAGTLLDLYGEEMRARAYVTADPVQGEMMLRPDFTVPVVQMHMAEGAEPARYCYLGEVFRKQDGPATRPSEYLQVGYEVFARDDPAAADAEVFALIAGLLAPLGLRAVTGDMGLLGAAVAGLTLSPARKAALARHIWRPARFRALIDRFAGRAPVPPARADLIARLRAEGAGAMIRAAGPLVGLRTEAEIEARAAALLADAEAPPLPEAEAARIDALLAVAGPAPEAAARLSALAQEMPAIAPAVAALHARLGALADRGVDPASLGFEASHGRTTMEYYDGFVFTLSVPGADLPPVASGGRYDALTARLGQGRSIPAVGAVIRPGLVADLAGGGA